MRRLVVVCAAVVLLLGACSGGDGEVRETVVEADAPLAMSVWAPEGADGLPVVYVVHGLANNRGDMARFAVSLAREGFVVFVPDIRTASPETGAPDIECGYERMIRTASEFGGDVGQPVTFVGWSYGAVSNLFSGLDDDATGPRGVFAAGACPLDAQRPDVLVSVAGCYSSFDGDPAPIDPEGLGWTNTDASLVLIAGDRDTACAPVESVEARDAFAAAGYAVAYHEVAGADHGSLMFNPPSRHGTVEAPEGEDGEAVVQIIVDAVADVAR